MQKKLIALAVAAVISAPAFADVNIVTTDGETLSLYGVFDAAVGNIQHSVAESPNFPFSVNPYSAVKTSTANTGSVSGLFNGGISDSRLGLKGSEDLGDGMKAFFDVETGFDLPSGQTNSGVAMLANGSNEAGANTSLNGQLFNRQAYAGISDATYGSIQGGLNYNPIADVLSKYDPVQYANLFSPLGFSGTVGGGGGISENTRVADSLKYFNKFGAVNVSVLLKMSGMPNSSSGGGAVNVGYEDGGFGIQAVYEQFQDVLRTAAGGGGLDTGGTGGTVGTATGIGTIAAENFNTSAFLVSAKYKMGDATVKAGYEHQVLKASSDQAATNQMLYGYVAAVTSSTGADLPVNVYYVGGDYNFTPTTNLAVGFYTISQPEVAATTGTATGTTANSQASANSNYVSLLLDHNFSKRTDAYLGAMLSMYSGNNFDGAYAGAPGTGGIGKIPGGAPYYNSNLITAAGLRIKF